MMLSVAEARARILAPLRATAPELVSLAEAWGRVTARPIHARLTQPPADISAMDGYAVRTPDAGAGASLRVIGSAPAGRPFAGAVAQGEAVRLFTGSVVPPGADTVVLQEDVDRSGDTVVMTEAAQAGRHIRRTGQDFEAGDSVLPARRRLNARDIGLAAAANHPWLAVHRRPRIAILATGDEISMPGEPIGSGGIVSSNAHALAAMVRAAGGTPVVMPIARDERSAIAAMADALGGIDLLVTTGGASVGDHDLVQSGLSERGFELDFWRIAMRPGKPLLYGRLGSVPVLGLPGNPVSAIICAVLFMLPAVETLSGLDAVAPPTERAALAEALGANDHRADHLRATLEVDAAGALVVRPFARQDSGLLGLLARADALILRTPHAPALPMGAPVDVVRLRTLGV